MAVTAKTGKLVGARVINNTEEQDMMIISSGGQVVRIGVKTVSRLGRATQGVRIMRFKKDGDKVVGIALL